MSILIIKQPDVELTEAEYRRFHDEYQALCSFYCGTPPSFEEFARGKKATERERGERTHTTDCRNACIRSGEAGG